MKKITSGILAFLLCFCLMIPAAAVRVDDTARADAEGGTEMAEGESVNPTESESSNAGTEEDPGPADMVNQDEFRTPMEEFLENSGQISAGNYMRLDTVHIYENMKSAYQDGYIPTVSGGRAILVLPVIPSGKFLNNEAEAKIDLGSTTSSPFIYGNYQKTVSLKAYSFGQEKLDVWLLQLELPLSSERINGIYPVNATMTARTEDGTAVMEMFTIYVTIADGKSGLSEEKVPVKETMVSQPKVLATSYQMKPETALAGEEIELTVTVKNTSETIPVSNLTVTAICDSLNFTLLNDSDVTYLSSLGCEEEKILTLKYRTDESTAAGKYSVRLEFSYEYGDAVPANSSGTAIIKLSQPTRVELTLPHLENTINAGETFPMNFQILNLGRGNLYNVRCEVSGNGLLSAGTAFAGNMAGGTEANAKINVFAGSVQMTEGYTGSELYGWTEGTVTLRYEDEDGHEYSEDYTFGITIYPPVITGLSGADEEESVENAGQWWITAGIGGVILLGAAGAAIFYARNRRQSI
ncbi:MAG: hypothetical protein MJ075_01130 [Oscillospiraceae bacterium]|nr:hypothetical protein [Oscillospiraceae bacterium]